MNNAPDCDRGPGPQPAPVGKERLRSTIASYCQPVSRALKLSGVDSEPVFRAAGIPIELSNDPLSRVPEAALTQLFQISMDITGNPYFGLTVGKCMYLSNLHALGHGLTASSTLMDFCCRLERYFRIASHSARASVTVADGTVQLRFTHLAEISGASEDTFLSFLVYTMRLLHSPGFNPVRVAFRHVAPPSGCLPYTELMRAPVSFGECDSMLEFSEFQMRQPLAGACPDLAQVNDMIAMNYLAKLDKDDIITRVTQEIIERLPNGECSRNEVAAALCMSPSSLQLKLSQRGTNFLPLVDEIRRELARSYMQQAGRSVTEITFLLGFTNASNFARAFKRWTGSTPTEFRHHG